MMAGLSSKAEGIRLDFVFRSHHENELIATYIIKGCLRDLLHALPVRITGPCHLR